MLRTRLVIAAAAVALLATACGSTDGAPAAGRSAAPTATSQASRGSTPGTTGGPSTDPTGPAPTATRRDGAQAEPTVVAARATPPRPGTYRYAQEGVSLFGEMPEEGTLVIGATDARGRQTHTRTVSKDEVIEEHVRFSEAGVHLLAVTQTFGSGAFARSYECRFSPALLVVRVPLRTGDRYAASSSCDDLSIDFEARVLRTETRRVAGQQVETVVIEATISARGEDVSQTTTTTSWLSPRLRLAVRSEQRSEGRQGSFSFHTSLTEELLDLRPR